MKIGQAESDVLQPDVIGVISEVIEYACGDGAIHPHTFCRISANSVAKVCVLHFMDTNLLDIKFARIGARLKVADRPSRRTRSPGVFSLDVQADRKGEFFEIVRQPGTEAEVAVLDVQPGDRHLLLLVREG